MSWSRTRLGGPTCGLLLLLALAGGLRADEIDDIAAQPADVALPRLEALLEQATAAGDEPRVARLQRVLADIHLRTGAPYAALPHLEARARRWKQPGDRVAYAEALVAVARQNMAARSMGRSVTPFLRDAVQAVEGLNLSPRAAADGLPVLPPALRARLVLVAVETHYLLQEYDEALAALHAAAGGHLDTLGGLPEERRSAVHDLWGRVLYARERYEEAAAAFGRAGNRLAAAAAWDAARLPEKSVPLYAEAIRARPADAALIGRALAGVRFTGAHALLLEGLAGVEVPAGRDGVPLLLARAELLEACGAAKDALPLLRDVAERDETNAEALVTLGRLLIVTGDAESEAVWDEAAGAYTAALERDPAHEGALAGLSFIAGRDFDRLWKAWRDERVVRRCLAVQQAMVEATPDDALAWSNLGNTLRVLGRVEASLAAYARAREANPFDPTVESDAGLALSAAGRADEALKAYLRSLELDPGHLAGRQNAARALWLQGDDEGAARHLGAAAQTARAVGRSPSTYRFLLARAWRTARRPSLR